MGLGFDPPKADQAHAYLWRRLGNVQIGPLVSLGNRLNQLRGERNRADYDLFRTIRRADAMAAVTAARDMVALLQRLTDIEEQQVSEAIRRYENDVLRESTWRGRPR